MTAPIRGPRGISEDRIVEMTGRTTADWNELLDAFDVHRHGHTAAARYLREAQGLSGWWAQAVTVRYEYARDLRDTLGMPEELATALDAAAVRNEFDRLSPTEQRQAFEAVQGAKRAETRERRIARVVAGLRTTSRMSKT